MSLYSLVLFFHVIAVLGLCAALSFEGLSLHRLRQSSTLTEVRQWIQPVPGLPLLTAGSAFVILLSGIYLTVRMSAFELAWPKVTIGPLLLIAPFGAMTGKRMKGIRQLCADAKPISFELTKRLQDPFLKVSLGIRTGVFLGIVLLMSAKPELWESILIVAASVILGLLSSLLAWRRPGSLSVSNAGLGD